MLPNYFPCSFLSVRFWLGQNSRFRMAFRIGTILVFCSLATPLFRSEVQCSSDCFLMGAVFVSLTCFRIVSLLFGFWNFTGASLALCFVFLFNLGLFIWRSDKSLYLYYYFYYFFLCVLSVLFRISIKWVIIFPDLFLMFLRFFPSLPPIFFLH